jgi:curved DNA-binding protein CbpA
MMFQEAGPGLGTQLGGLLDTFLSGHRPSPQQIDQVIAGVATRLAGRPVSMAEIEEIRAGLSSAAHFSPSSFGPSSRSSSGSDTSWYQRARDAAARAAQNRAPPDPAAQRAAYEQKLRLRKITEARSLLGFTPKEPITKEMLKARHRELAKKHHPDRGGSADMMAKINDAMDTLSDPV